MISKLSPSKTRGCGAHFGAAFGVGIAGVGTRCCIKASKLKALEMHIEISQHLEILLSSKEASTTIY
jgi:hypothetical protein